MTMPDPKSLLALAKATAPAFSLIRGHWALRDAGTGAIDFTSYDKELTTNFRILSQDAAVGPTAMLDWLKGKLVDRPDWFDEEPIRTWLRTERVEQLVKDAAKAIFERRDWDAYRVEAGRFYASFPEAENEGLGLAAFEYAAAFVCLALLNKLDLGDRMILSQLSVLQRQVSDATAPIPLGLIDEHILGELDRLRRMRFFPGSDHKDRSRRLIVELDGGVYSQASDDVRARGLALCARYLTRDEPSEWIAAILTKADLLVATEDAFIARAIDTARSDGWQAGLSALKPIDRPERRTAAIQILGAAPEQPDVLAWVDAAGIDPAGLDSDGRFLLLMARLAAKDWAAAHRHALALRPEDLAATPAASFPAGKACLTQVVAEDLRELVAVGQPIDGKSFPLWDTEIALDERRRAARFFREAERAARALDFAEAAQTAKLEALWLELRDPESSAAARSTLRAQLDNGAIAYVPLAIAFDIEIDLAAIERILDRCAAIDPDGDQALALARLALGRKQPTPSDQADYLARYRTLIWRHLDAAEIGPLEVNLLVAAGRSIEAQERLDAIAPDLPPALVTELRADIAHGADGPPIAQLEQDYEQSPSTLNLSVLVNALAQQGFSDKFWQRARELVHATRAHREAEMVVRFLERHDRHAELDQLLDDIADMLPGSADLSAAFAWSLWRRGRVAEAERVLTPLRTARTDRNDRTLWINILVTTGRWSELSPHIEAEWDQRDARTAADLLGLAATAQAIGSPRVRELLECAAAKGENDPQVLAECYFAAVRAGDEDDPVVQTWFERAAAQSDESGPLVTANLEALVESAPDWLAHSETVWTQLRNAEAPLHIGAKLLNRPSLEPQLVAMVANLHEADPRRRAVIPAFSGVREPLELAPARIGLDGSAAVTLALLNLLHRVCERGDILIPHMMLSWLFAERQRLSFHQPSQIRAAHGLSRSLTARRLHIFVPATTSDEPLIEKVGRSLAAMLTMAAARQAGDRQRLVVRSAPVNKPGSFSGGGVDLSAFAPQLVSCTALLDKLVSLGQLTQEEENHARAYLVRQEERWPDEPEMDDEADLYLDDLSVAYLRVTRLFERLQGLGYTIYVSQDQMNDASALLQLEDIASEVDAVIEHIRQAFADGLAGGTVRLDAIPHQVELRQHPNLAIIDLASRVDAIVCDDRFLNKVRGIDRDGDSTPILISLDLLETLRRTGIVDAAELERARTTLRRAGAAHVPPGQGELTELIGRTKLAGEQIRETGELRAFRENILLVQQRNWLRLPAESPWLNAVDREIVDAIAAQWSNEIADPLARARCRWLWARIDMRNWCAALDSSAPLVMASYGHVLPLVRLMMLRIEKRGDELARFDAWLDDEIVTPLREGEPAVYTWLLDYARQMVLELGVRWDDADEANAG